MSAKPAVIHLKIGGIALSIEGSDGGRLASAYKLFLHNSPAECRIRYGAVASSFVPLYSEAGLEMGRSVDGSEVLRLSDQGGMNFCLQFPNDITAIHNFSAGDGHEKRIFPSPPVFITAMTRLLSGRGVFLHAMAGIFQNQGFLFCGGSGAGKSTLAKRWHSEGVKILSDERVIITLAGNDLLIHGSPWPGSAEFISAESAPLRHFFLLRPDGPALHRVFGASEFLDWVLPLTYHRPWDPGFSAFVISFLARAVETKITFGVNRSTVDSAVRFFERLNRSKS